MNTMFFSSAGLAHLVRFSVLLYFYGHLPCTLKTPYTSFHRRLPPLLCIIFRAALGACLIRRRPIFQLDRHFMRTSRANDMAFPFRLTLAFVSSRCRGHSSACRTGLSLSSCRGFANNLDGHLFMAFTADNFPFCSRSPSPFCALFVLSSSARGALPALYPLGDELCHWQVASTTRARKCLSIASPLLLHYCLLFCPTFCPLLYAAHGLK